MAWAIWEQTGFELDLSHNGECCPQGSHQYPNDARGPVPIDNEAWEDINQDDIPSYLWPPTRSDYLTIVDVTSIHFITVNYCTCPDSEPEYLQLLQCKFFPATLQMPRTAFTFRMLDDFIQDNLECGASRMNCYSKLWRITSNVFPHMYWYVSWAH